MDVNLYKVGVKNFVSRPEAVDIRDVIPVFQRWIQHQKIDGHLLIDVHDYSHVHEGPGILLVGHEGNFSMDEAHGHLGLFYYRKQPLAGDTEANLKVVRNIALDACKLLESEPKLNGIKFSPGELLVVINDRLLVPNDDATRARIEPVIARALGRAVLAPQAADPRERLAFIVILS